MGSRVAAESAGAEGQGGVAFDTCVVDTAAVAGGRVAAEGATAHGQCGVVVVDAAADGVPKARTPGVAVGDGQVGDGDDLARADMEHAAGRVAVHGQVGCARTHDSHVFIDEKFAADQRDRAGDGKINCVPIGCAGEDAAQSASSGAIVRCGGDGECGGARGCRTQGGSDNEG